LVDAVALREISVWDAQLRAQPVRHIAVGEIESGNAQACGHCAPKDFDRGFGRTLGVLYHQRLHRMIFATAGNWPSIAFTLTVRDCADRHTFP
jgi:hypothetical protein